MRTAWVVTKEVDDNKQYGDYFVGVFLTKPSTKRLAKLLSMSPEDSIIKNLATGGGRITWEYEWYSLEEVEIGKNYERG